MCFHEYRVTLLPLLVVNLGRQLPRICTDLQHLNTFKILAIFLGKGGLLPFFMFYCIFITKFSENLGFRGDLCGVHPLH